MWVCVCAQQSSITHLLGWQYRQRPGATRVVFKTDLVEFFLPWAEADEAGVARPLGQDLSC